MKYNKWKLTPEHDKAYRSWESDELTVDSNGNACGRRYLWKCRFCGRFLGKVDEDKWDDTAPCKQEHCQTLAALLDWRWV